MPLQNKSFRFKVRVFGKVQGVWFRKFTMEKADSLKLLGWVRNEKDSSVSTEFQGDYKTCLLMLDWLSEGSPLSDVENIKIDQIPPIESESAFEVLR